MQNNTRIIGAEFNIQIHAQRQLRDSSTAPSMIAWNYYRCCCCICICYNRTYNVTAVIETIFKIQV